MEALMKSKYKVVLLGDGGVGKTSLVKRFVHSKFDDKYQKTLGTNVYVKDIMIRENNLTTQVNLQIWDVLGQGAFKNVIRSALRGTQGVILVCDLTRKDSLGNIQRWLYSVYQHLDSASFVLLGNKSDLQKKEFGLEDMQTYAHVFNAQAYLTSAKTGENVEKAFQTISSMLLNEVRGPNKDKVRFPEYEEEIQANVKAEDRLIDIFCKEVGGYEIAMPIVREQFKRLDIDFENPTRQELELVIEKLVLITKEMRTDKDVKELHRKLRNALFQVE